MVAHWACGGSWDFSRLSEIVNTEIIQRLIAILPPIENGGDDFMVWNGSRNGLFSVKSCYRAICGDYGQYDSVGWPRCKGIAIIALSMKRTIIPYIRSCTTAKESWDKLASLYQVCKKVHNI